MNDYGIHAIVISNVKVFNGEELKSFPQSQISKTLMDLVASEPNFDDRRIEIVTTGEPYFNYSGKIFGPIPDFHEVVSKEQYERELDEGESADSFKFHASVRLSVTYFFEEFEEFMEWAKDEGDENPNLFTWMEYCTQDAFTTLRELTSDRSALRDELTVRGH